MRTDIPLAGQHELRLVRKRSRGLYWAVGLFSFFANLLMLTGPLYMLQVYDRVLGSGSEETLIALSLLVAFLFVIMGMMDLVRGRIMARVSARFHADLEERVFDAVIRRATQAPQGKESAGSQDLDAVQRFMQAPVLLAMFDIPWSPIFFAAIFLFHPLLGWLALAGAGILVLLTLANQVLSRADIGRTNQAGRLAGTLSDRYRTEAEQLQSLGMRRAALQRWQRINQQALEAGVQAGDVTTAFSAASKTMRLLLQSMMLGLGAWLVLQDQLTAGAMIAGSILLGRALAPIESILNQWPVVQRAMTAWEGLAQLLGHVRPEAPRTELPRPAARLTAKALTIVPPGARQAALRGLDFEVQPGQALGVIGPSGSGKTTLARTLTGVWPPAGGQVRLDGAALDQYGPERLGQHIGYLPQRVHLFDGTIAENIARLATEPDDALVVAAAKMAAAHEMILALPQGYDTIISEGYTHLSGGQIQRIGLARALYGDPVIVVLDEPNANLDRVGSEAMNHAIRALKARGGSVLVMAHRPSAIQECELLLMLENGMRVAYGPRDKVLAEMVSNHEKLRGRTAGAGSVT